MAQDYAEYLAINVLNEQQLVGLNGIQRVKMFDVNRSAGKLSFSQSSTESSQQSRKTVR